MQDPNLIAFRSSDEEEFLSATQNSTSTNEMNPVIGPVVNVHVQRRPSAGPARQTGTEIQKMLDNFGADINKALLAKRKRMEEYTTASFKSSKKKFEQVWKMQKQQMQKFSDDCSQQFTTMFQQWDLDMQKYEEKQETFADSIQKQHEAFLQTKTESIQILKTIRQVHLEYIQSLQISEKDNDIQLTDPESELKKELRMFKGKIMKDATSYTSNGKDVD